MGGLGNYLARARNSFPDLSMGHGGNANGWICKERFS